MPRAPLERRDLALLFGWNFAAVTAVFVGRTVRDVLFLSYESPARLPYLYILSPVIVTLVGLGYGRIADRVPRDRLVVVTSLIIAALAAATRLSLGPRWLYYALYVGSDCTTALVMMQFWISAGERFTPREAKRWFGVIAAGGTAANIVIGFAMTGIVRRTGAEDLLWIVVGAMVVVAVAAIAVARRDPPRPRPRARGSPGLRPGTPPGTSHLSVLGPMLACTILAVTLLDFQFKAIATAAYGGDRVAMVQFFATVSAISGAAALLIQLTLTGRILARFGVAGALLLLPTTLALGAVALLVVPSLAAATACKAADQTMRYTVHDAGTQLLYLPVPSAVRTRRKAMFDAVLRPGCEATVGAALLVYRTFAGALAPLAIAAIVVTTTWAGLAIKMRGAYTRALGETLRRRRVIASSPDEDHASREVVVAARDALASGDRDRVLNALDLARLAPVALQPELERLVTHALAAIPASALAALAAADAVIADAQLVPALADPDPAVQAAAVRAATGAQLEHVPRLLAGVPAVATAAVVVLHRRGSPAQREAAVARMIAMIVDGDVRVRRAGMTAATEVADPAAIPALRSRLADDHDRPRAIRALAAVGEPAVTPLLASLDERSAPAALRALGAIGGDRAVAAILDHLADPDEARRTAACAALAAATRTRALADPARAVAACRAELVRAFTAMAAAEDLGRDESVLAADGTRAPVPFAPGTEEGPAALISRALRERHERAAARAFDLLAAVDPTLELDVVRTNLREPDPTRRANAVELLDARTWHYAIAPLRPLILTLVDESARERKLEAVSGRLELPRHTRDGWVAVLLDDPNPWIVACTAYLAGAAGIVAVRAQLDALASSPHALVAATAREATLRLDHPDRKDPMLTTVDKILFLKGLELFTQIPGEDLADLAGLTEEVTLDDGERLFAEHDPGDALFLVVDGRVRITRGSSTLAELGVREVIGEMALLDPAPRSADATAVGAVRLLRLGRDDFANLIAERPEVAAGVLRVLTRRLRAANQGSRVE